MAMDSCVSLVSDRNGSTPPRGRDSVAEAQPQPLSDSPGQTPSVLPAYKSLAPAQSRLCARRGAHVDGVPRARLSEVRSEESPVGTKMQSSLGARLWNGDILNYDILRVEALTVFLVMEVCEGPAEGYPAIKPDCLPPGAAKPRQAHGLQSWVRADGRSESSLFYTTCA